ncbi:hypothetical protein [Plantibacter sp. RU18]|uniref:hypothetical protein n=1 Tax=Plantibacter sp. RU18 TaxID=3158143 RepID=UPI003D35CAEA
MVEGMKSAKDVLKSMRKHARRLGYSVESIPGRGKGSHSIWVVLDPSGKELGRIGLTGHTGDMSHTVTRSNEQALEGLFGKGWLDK